MIYLIKIHTYDIVTGDDWKSIINNNKLKCTNDPDPAEVKDSLSIQKKIKKRC